MKKIYGVAAILLLVAAALYLSLNPNAPTATLFAPARQNSLASVARSSAVIPSVPTSAPSPNTPTIVSSQSQAPSPKLPVAAGELIPDQGPLTEVGPETALQNVQRAIRQYGDMFGGNPVGTNPEITSQLSGDNPKHINFINPQPGAHINASGELVDAWGTPYFFHQISGSEMEIYSAGPDKIMWTSDDLVVK